MKIVDEIVLEVGGGRQWHSGTVNAGELESVIAAKLEPVKDALRFMWYGNPDMTAGEMIEKYEAALALFEEE